MLFLIKISNIKLMTLINIGTASMLEQGKVCEYAYSIDLQLAH